MRRVLGLILLTAIAVMGVFLTSGKIKAAAPGVTVSILPASKNFTVGKDTAENSASEENNTDLEVVVKGVGRMTSAKLQLKMSNSNAEFLLDKSSLNTEVTGSNAKNKISLSSGVLTIGVTLPDGGVAIDGEEGVRLATIKVWGKKAGKTVVSFTGTSNKVVVVETVDGTPKPAVSASLTKKSSTMTIVTSDKKAYWKMDETEGKTVVDAKGFYPAYANNTNMVAGKSGFGNARNFATGDLIKFKAIPLGLRNAFTLGVWVKPGGCSSGEVPFVSQTGGFILGSKKLSSGDCVPFGRLISGDNKIDVAGSSSSKLSKGTWYHLILSWDGSKLKLYRNGVSVKEFSDPSQAYLGMDTIVLGSSKFSGAMDNFQIFNKGLSVSEVSSVYSGQPWDSSKLSTLTNLGLTGWWTMNETSENSLVDSSGKNNTATALMGGITTGISYNGRTFNGINSSIGTTKVMAVGASFSVEAWVKPAVEPVAGLAGIVQTSESAGFSLTASSDGTGYRAVVKGVKIEGGKLVANKWQHIVVTYSKAQGKMSLFVDGQEVNNAAASAPGTTGYKVVIGKNGTNYWNGVIDEVIVYNNSLSAEEVADNYDNYQGKTDAPSCHMAVCENNPNNKHAEGDANCDGTVDPSDFGLWWNEYYLEGSRGSEGRDNWKANFNCEPITVNIQGSQVEYEADNKVDMTDFTLLLYKLLDN